VIAMHKQQSGFALLEILVAFSILALSLGVLMQIFSGSLRNVGVAHDQAQAVVLAQSLLASAGVETSLIAGENSGVIDDKFRWSLRINPFIEAPRPGDTEALRSLRPLALWEVTTRITWDGDARLPESVLTLTTLRAQPVATPP